MPNTRHPRIADVLKGTVWALDESKYEQVAALLESLGPDVASRASEDYSEVHKHAISMQGDMAVVPVNGVMMRHANMFTKISDSTSTDLLSKALRDLADDPNVKGIALQINSPGGTVDGIDTVKRAVEYAASKKPLAALADSAALSGGYWLGASAPKFFATPDALVGSIGVIASRMDYSEAMEAAGVKEHVFRAGRYKALGQGSEPLTEDERTDTQRIVDHFYTMFVDHVAEHRGLDTEAVADTQARVYGVHEALSLNLIDDVKTLEQVLESLGAEADANAQVEGLSTAYGLAVEENTALQTQLADALARIEALEGSQAEIAEKEEAARIDAAVKTLIEVEQKVAPMAADALRARLEDDFDGTMASFALVPAAAAAPASAPALAAEESKPDLVAEAKEKEIPIAATPAQAKVYNDFHQTFLDASVEGEAPVFRNLKGNN